ncbi:MAG: dockerin type I repeat-containing protein, partial [Clostridiales bacterium]|nr:dockerin type I repeat-containing protein [Candidatus Coliplasma caballi]
DPGSKLGHDYGTPTYVWNGDQCTATRVCSHDDSHIETETVKGIYVKDTDATCEENEKGHYEATFTNPAFAKQSTAKNSVEVPETKIGHSFTNYVSDNNATCTADGTKTAHCDHAGCEETDTIADVDSKLGHNYDKPTYKWNGDECTATMVCLNDSSHPVIETATAVYVKDTNATCTENEKGHYEVTFQNGAFEQQFTEKNSVEKQGTKLGHNYVSVVTPPTETERGYTTHTCSHCHDSYVDSYTDPIPAVTYGDINGDGAIDAFDYRMLKAFVLGTFKDVTNEQKEAMDVNHDGCADAFDYQMVKAHVLGTYVIQ